LHDSHYSKIATITFFLLLLFTVWGTSMPFGARVEDVDEMSSANIINQILYSALFLLSSFTLFRKRNELVTIIIREKFLFLFIGFAFLSILWSDYGFVTFKRIFRLLAEVLTIISFLLYTDSSDKILKLIKYVFYPYIILTIIVVFTIPGALDPSFHTWRGFTSHKNTLGQLSLISIFLCYILFKIENTQNGKILAAVMLALSIVILFGALSSTSIITFLIIVGFGVILSIDSIFKPIGLGRATSFLVFLILAAFIVAVLIWVPELEKIIPSVFGKDMTFSGRTDLWNYLLSELSFNHIWGTGFQSFWVVGNKNIMLLYKTFVWLPNQAHNGYIDIYIQSGIIGIILTILIVFSYFINYIKITKPHPWVIFVFITLITNFQESTLLRPGQSLNTIFIFSYLILFINYNKEFSWFRKTQSSKV
jgi:exopolysaccharide production protein ExoQ